MTSLTRRDLGLAGISAVAAGSMLGACPACAQPEAGAPRIIDTHHHLYPPGYTHENMARMQGDTPMLPPSVYFNWTPRGAVERMDQAGVATAITSITSPGVWFDDGEAARVRARECNEFGAQMARDFPGRFGMFAAIPLPDTEGSLREIAHALDVLKLDGIGVLTSYAGKLLGDPAFAAVFDELNRRKAAVFVHPTISCCGNLMPGVYAPTLEFPMDTVRTIVSLIFMGTYARCPDIRFIFSHGGGVLPMVVQRIAGAVRSLTAEERTAKMPKGLEYELQRQYYDIASVGVSAVAMAAVLKLYPISQLLYGSDEPFGSMAQIASGLSKFGLADPDARAIRRDNALRLFPRYAA